MEGWGGDFRDMGRHSARLGGLATTGEEQGGAEGRWHGTSWPGRGGKEWAEPQSASCLPLHTSHQQQSAQGQLGASSHNGLTGRGEGRPPGSSSRPPAPRESPAGDVVQGLGHSGDSHHLP